MNENQFMSPIGSPSLNFHFVEWEAGISRALNLMCCERIDGEGQLYTFLLQKQKVPTLQGRDWQEPLLSSWAQSGHESKAALCGIYLTGELSSP